MKNIFNLIIGLIFIVIYFLIASLIHPYLGVYGDVALMILFAITYIYYKERIKAKE